MKHEGTLSSGETSSSDSPRETIIDEITISSDSEYTLVSHENTLTRVNVDRGTLSSSGPVKLQHVIRVVRGTGELKAPSQVTHVTPSTSSRSEIIDLPDYEVANIQQPSSPSVGEQTTNSGKPSEPPISGAVNVESTKAQNSESVPSPVNGPTEQDAGGPLVANYSQKETDQAIEISQLKSDKKLAEIESKLDKRLTGLESQLVNSTNEIKAAIKLVEKDLQQRDWKQNLIIGGIITIIIGTLIVPAFRPESKSSPQQPIIINVPPYSQQPNLNGTASPSLVP